MRSAEAIKALQRAGRRRRFKVASNASSPSRTRLDVHRERLGGRGRADRVVMVHAHEGRHVERLVHRPAARAEDVGVLLAPRRVGHVGDDPAQLAAAVAVVEGHRVEAERVREHAHRRRPAPARSSTSRAGHQAAPPCAQVTPGQREPVLERVLARREAPVADRARVHHRRAPKCSATRARAHDAVLVEAPAPVRAREVRAVDAADLVPARLGAGAVAREHRVRVGEPAQHLAGIDRVRRG